MYRSMETRKPTYEEVTELLKEVAEDSPITEILPEVNGCRYCQQSWAERSYDTYLENEAKIAVDPDARQSNGIHRIRWEHHNTDCLWVKANKLLASR